MSVSRRLRFEVLRRDSYTCRYCGDSAPDAVLTVDHVIPLALGGGDEPNNLVTACKDCNAGKSSVQPDGPIVEDVDAAAMLWAKAIERAAEIRQAEMASLEGHFILFDEAWLDWTYGPVDNRRYLPRPVDWRTSIERFLAAGLDHDDLARAVRIAGESKARPEHTWRYFCGVCWNEIAQRQEIARTLIEDGEV